jgi:hypothetical protein
MSALPRGKKSRNGQPSASRNIRDLWVLIDEQKIMSGLSYNSITVVHKENMLVKVGLNVWLADWSIDE